MNRFHALVVSLVLGAAGVVGAIAATQTIHLGAASAAPAQTDRAALRTRARRLNAWARSLNGSLAKRPPALPAVPRFAPVAVGSYGTAVPTAVVPAVAAPSAKAAVKAPRRDAAAVGASKRSARPAGAAPPRTADQPANEPTTTTPTPTTTTQGSEPTPTVTPAAAPVPPPVTTTTTASRGDGGGEAGDNEGDDPPEPGDDG